MIAYLDDKKKEALRARNIIRFLDHATRQGKAGLETRKDNELVPIVDASIDYQEIIRCSLWHINAKHPVVVVIDREDELTLLLDHFGITWTTPQQF